MKIKDSFYTKGNTEYYNFAVEIVFLTEEDKKDNGYYITFLPIFKQENNSSKLNEFKVGYRLSTNQSEDIDLLNKILKNKENLLGKYIPKVESKLKEKHLKKLENLNTENMRDVIKDSPKEDTESPLKLRDIEKEIIAVHETGHAIVGILLGEFNIDKDLITLNINSEGFMSNLYKENSCISTKSELNNKIKILLAGKVAEELVFKEHSTSIYDDLKQSSKIALDMVSKYGMGNRASLFIDPYDNNDYLMSENIKKAESILSSLNKDVAELLKSYKKELRLISSELYNKNELSIDFIKDILNKNTKKS